MKKLAKAQAGKIVKKVAKVVAKDSKPIFKKGAGALAAGTGAGVVGVSYLMKRPTTPSKSDKSKKSPTWYKEGIYKKDYENSPFKDDIDRNKQPYPKDIDIKKKYGGNLKSKKK